MTKPKILSETPITMAELRESLSRVKERDEGLGFRGSKAEDYLNTFVKLSREDTNKLIDEIRRLNIPRLGDDIIVKIGDILPSKIEELKVLLQAYHITVTKENVQKMIDVVAKFV